MAKYDDVRSAGRSDIVPFISGESWEERHARRLGAAAAMHEELRVFAEARRLELRVLNDGHHLLFRSGWFQVD